MRYGISIPPFGPYSEVRKLADIAHQAERSGWDGFFLWDHVVFGSLPVADPWIALTAVALNTIHMRLGTLVTPLPRRRPSKIARETVTVDHLSDGRLVLGVGIGSGAWEWDNLGEATDLKTRGDMLDESLELLTQMWSGEPFIHRGHHYLAEGDASASGLVRFLPAARQTPRIPIWVAGEWPNRRPFRRAAHWDGVVPIEWVPLSSSASANLVPSTMMAPQELAKIVAYVGALRDDPTPFEIVMTGHTPGDPSAGATVVAPYAAVGATWWLENISPWRFAWDWHGPWPLEQMEQRILEGPPSP